jgi:hypothetical protein
MPYPAPDLYPEPLLYPEAVEGGGTEPTPEPTPEPPVPTPAPAADIGVYGEELYEQVLPMHGPDSHGLLRDLIGAYVSQALEVDDLARDDEQGRPGWGVILDVDECPVKGLPWLAQIAGVTLRAPKLVIARINMAVPPSGEDGILTALTSVNATTTAEATGLATAGAYNFHSVRDAASDMVIFWGVGLTQYQGVAYTFGLDVLRTDAPARLELYWYHDDGSTLALLGTVTGPASTDIGRRVLTAVAPAGTNTVRIAMRVTGSTVGDIIDHDAATLEPAATNGSFFDGSTPGGRWLGAPQESSSVWERLEHEDEWAAYARDAIKRQGGENRGTPDAILSAAGDTLTGTRTMRLLERAGGNAYALDLVTRPSETPDPDATLAAALTQKPAGDSLTLTLTDSVLIDEGTRTIDSAGAAIDAATLGDVTT